MNSRHSTPTPRVLFALLAALTPAPAEIDSGGGSTSGGALNNHSSIGAAFATVTTQGDATLNHPGLIEVLYPAAPASADSDGNGLPDAWEILHFGYIGVDPNADPDHDGATNLMEYLAGTDPNSASSVVRPQGSYAAGIFHMPIQTASGRYYQIWVSRDMKASTLQTTLTSDGTQQPFDFDEARVPSGPLHSGTHSSNYFFHVAILIPLILHPA